MTAEPLASLASEFTAEPPASELTGDQIDQTLQTFRHWLTDLQSLPQTEEPPRKSIDLFTLVGHFLALKQEVNLQTRASRATLDQNTQALKLLAEVSERAKQPPPPVGPLIDEKLKPLLKAVVDVYDSLSMATKQIEKQRESLERALSTLQESILLDELPPVSETIPTEVAAIGFWARLFGRKPGSGSQANPLLEERQALDQWREMVQILLDERQEAIEEATTFIDEALDGLLTGYGMSLSRIEKILSQFSLEPIPTEGEMFDPEEMEVLEAVPNSGLPTGEVVEEVRRGYRWRGVIFRYAQVRVAR